MVLAATRSPSHWRRHPPTDSVSTPLTVKEGIVAAIQGFSSHAATIAVGRRKAACAILRHMKVEEIAEAVADLPPDQLARFRRWFTAFEAGRTDHAEELGSAATKLGRLAGRAFAELKRRAKEP
jgi:hypothetical protein